MFHHLPQTEREDHIEAFPVHPGSFLPRRKSLQKWPQSLFEGLKPDVNL